jgi:hypothetical protein
MKTCQASIKQSTKKMGSKRCRMMKDPSLGRKKKPPTKGRSQGQHEQIKYSNPLASPYQIRRGEEHVQEHLA